MSKKIISETRKRVYAAELSRSRFSARYYIFSEASDGSMWQDNICLLNEQPVIQNDFILPQQEEFGISEGKFNL